MAEPWYKRVHALPALTRPAIGGLRASLKDNPKIFNVALRVPGDERLSKAAAADLVALSAWFGAYLSSAEGLGGSADLLEGVTVPCEVPWETLEAVVDGLYAVRVLFGRRVASAVQVAEVGGRQRRWYLQSNGVLSRVAAAGQH